MLSGENRQNMKTMSQKKKASSKPVNEQTALKTPRQIIKTKAHVFLSRSNYQKQFQRLCLGEKQTSCLVCFLCFLLPDDCAMRFLLHSRRRKKALKLARYDKCDMKKLNFYHLNIDFHKLSAH